MSSTVHYRSYMEKFSACTYLITLPAQLLPPAPQKNYDALDEMVK